MKLFRRRTVSKGLMYNINRWGYVFLIPFFVGFLVFGLFPICYSLVLSLMRYDGIHPMKFIGFKNYIDSFAVNNNFLISIKNMSIVLAIFIPLLLFLSLILAYALYQPTVKLRKSLQVMCLLPYLTTPVAAGIIFSLLFDRKTGVVNTVLIRTGIIEESIWWLGEAATARFVLIVQLLWKNIGFTAILIYAGLLSVSESIIESAKIDGANARQILMKIILPSIKAVMIFLVLTNIIYGFQMYEDVQQLFAGWGVMTPVEFGGPDKSVLTPIWLLQSLAYSAQRFGRGSSVAFLLSLVIGAFAILNFRLLTRKKIAETDSH